MFDSMATLGIFAAVLTGVVISLLLGRYRQRPAPPPEQANHRSQLAKRAGVAATTHWPRASAAPMPNPVRAPTPLRWGMDYGFDDEDDLDIEAARVDHQADAFEYDSSTINPATGLWMTGGLGSIDTAGNPFGFDVGDDSVWDTHQLEDLWHGCDTDSDDFGFSGAHLGEMEMEFGGCEDTPFDPGS